MGLILIFLVLSLFFTPLAFADDLVWKESIKPLNVTASYTSYNDFFLYDGVDKSEQQSTVSLSSRLAQEGQGWGYELSIDGTHSLNDISARSQGTYKNRQLGIEFEPAIYLSEKQRLYFNLAHHRKTLRPGEGLAQFALSSGQLESRQSKVATTWRYGSEFSPRYVDVEVGITREEYNRDTVLAMGAEYQSVYSSIELGFAYTQASHLITKLRYQEDSYQHSNTRDASYMNAQVGLSWKPSSATRLKLLAGYFSRDFEQA